MSPVKPVAPVRPVSPVAPRAPVAPGTPRGPINPRLLADVNVVPSGNLMPLATERNPVSPAAPMVMSCELRIDRIPVAVSRTLPIRSESAPSISNTPSSTDKPACLPVLASWMKRVPGPSCRLFQRNTEVPSVYTLSADGMRSPVVCMRGVHGSLSVLDAPLSFVPLDPSAAAWFQVSPGGQ